jgi:hypothetical protein
LVLKLFKPAFGRICKRLGGLKRGVHAKMIDKYLIQLEKMRTVPVSVQYEDTYRFCYIRGPEGILIGSRKSSGSKLPDEHI